jgi:hypothetical protein
MREAWRFVSGQFGTILGLVGLLWGSVWSSTGPLGASMDGGSMKANKNSQTLTHAKHEANTMVLETSRDR